MNVAFNFNSLRSNLKHTSPKTYTLHPISWTLLGCCTEVACFPHVPLTSLMLECRGRKGKIFCFTNIPSMTGRVPDTY